MRGTPFLKEGWTGGLNTIDSPYTLAENEARECLNVVSSERGSIRKRYGSSLFTPPTEVFPSTSVKDTLERTSEKPLSNAGKWTVIPGFENTGETSATKHWTPTGKSGAYWNEEEQANPAVSLEVTVFSHKFTNYYIGVWCSMSAAGSGYFLEVRAFNEEVARFTIQKWTAGKYIESIAVRDERLAVGMSIGLSVRGSKVRAWCKAEGTWNEVTSATDASYNKGYTGIAGLGLDGANNFAYAEIASGGNVPSVEFDSLFSCYISGTPYLLAAGGGHIYSITASGTITSIGEGFSSNYWSFCQAPESTAVASQGPIYMSNGVDKPHFWTGVAKNTAVAEWKGVSSATKYKDGLLAKAATTIKLEEEKPIEKFISSDVGLPIVFTTSVKVAGVVITEALIEEVLSPTEIKVAINEEGWEAEYSKAEFTLERSFYPEEAHVPNGQFLTFFGNRIWMTGIKADPSAVWFSELTSIGAGGEQADPSQWPTTNVVRFDSSDGHEVTGISPTGPYLLLFKEKKTWVIHDINSGANRRLSDSVGCVAQRSIVETNNGTFFLTADQGIYLTEGSKLHEMSYNVRPTILNINPAQRQYAAGAYYNNHYYLSFAFGTSNVSNRTLDYDVQLKSWWLHDLTGNQWVIHEPISGQPALYTIPPKSKAGVVKCFVEGLYEDSGAVYTGEKGLTAFWVSPWEPFAYYVFRHRIKAPFLKKRVRAIHFDGEGVINPLVYRNFQTYGSEEPGVVGKEEQQNTELPVNFSQGETVYGNENEEQLYGGETYKGVQMIFGGSAQVQDARVYSPGVARVWGVGFGNKTNEGFVVDSATYFISFRKS